MTTSDLLLSEGDSIDKALAVASSPVHCFQLEPVMSSLRIAGQLLRRASAVGVAARAGVAAPGKAVVACFVPYISILGTSWLIPQPITSCY